MLRQLARSKAEVGILFPVPVPDSFEHVKEAGMPNKKFLLAALVAISGFLFAPRPASAADQEKVLYAFDGGADGISPSGTLVFDAVGNLYGTTVNGGDYRCELYMGCGTVFKLQPAEQGTWSKTILHSFEGQDGAYPSAGLIFDAAGNLYGTTISGGTKGSGTVFKLAPGGHGEWTETVLHDFDNWDGEAPAASLIFDKSGNLYGTTREGGRYDSGIVFKLATAANGEWTETVLHTFNGKDGSDPLGALTFDSAGNLYGTTVGAYDTDCSGSACGNVFKLAPATDGKWTETVLHSFGGRGGSGPGSALVLDRAGNLYGTTTSGGNLKTCSGDGCGTVFQLIPSANGKWTEKVLHTFNGRTDGSFPYAGLIFDAAGNLYGATWYGGVVFELVPDKDGKWTETVLHAFSGKDGWFPYAGLIFDASGNLYGTTQLGGKLKKCDGEYGKGCGVVFEITEERQP
jgi:uncharacterized repeat protein (TIGR03803 family)